MKMDGADLGVTKIINKNIRKDNLFQKQIILNLYLYGHVSKKTFFYSSLVFATVCSLNFVRLSLSFSNDIFIEVISCESLKINNS